jgi:hypothetical protein
MRQSRVAHAHLGERNHFVNVMVGEFLSHAPFARGIYSVVGLRSEKQMVWIYAGWIIATMTYQHARWDWAAPCFIGDPTRHLATILDKQRAIAFANASTDPFPTT